MKSISKVGFIEILLVSALEYVRNPWFPSTSIALGNLSEWFIKFTRWMGIRLGIVGQPLRMLVRRRNQVQWSKLPAWIRLGVGVMAGVAAFVTLGCMTKLAEGKFERKKS